jgi:large subunit ribosomal protein L4
MKRKALFMALSEKLSVDSIVVTEALSFSDHKTNQVSKALNNLPLGNKVLMVLPKTDLNIWRAVRNLGNIQVIVADSLNVIDVLKAKTVLMSEDSLEVINAVYLKK